jgi:excisionase family DNA binding protein
MSSVEDRTPPEVNRRLLGTRTVQLDEHVHEDTLTFTVADTVADSVPSTQGLSLAQAAQRAGRSKTTIHRWIKLDMLPATQVAGGGYRIDAADVDAVVARLAARRLADEINTIPLEVRAEVLVRFHEHLQHVAQALKYTSEPVSNYLHRFTELAALEPSAPQLQDLLAEAAQTVPAERRGDPQQLLRALWPFQWRNAKDVPVLPSPSTVWQADAPEQTQIYNRTLANLLAAEGLLDPPVLGRDGYIEILTQHAVWGTIEGIHNGGKRRTGWRGDRIAPTYTIDTRHGTIYVSVRDPSGSAEPDDAAMPMLWNVVDELDDRLSDAVLVMFAHWSALATRPDEKVWISDVALLDAFGIRAKRYTGKQGGKEIAEYWDRGHRHEDRVELSKRLSRLAQIWIGLDLNIPTRKGRTKRIVYEDRLFSIGPRLGQYDLQGEVVTLAMQYAPGAWLAQYWDEDLPWRGLLAQKAIEYDPYHKQAEKRLAKYLAFHFRIDAHRRQRKPLNRKVTLLVAAAGIALNRDHPEWTRRRLEEAFDTLVGDEVCAAWRYAPEFPGDTRSKEERLKALPARNWLPTWLAWSIDVTPTPRTVSYHEAGGITRALPPPGQLELGPAARQG